MRVIDIAAAAGVSPSTISRVLHGSSQISPETKEHVKNIMRQLGYTPTFYKGRKVIYPKNLHGPLSKCIAALAIGDFTVLDYTCSGTNLKNLSAALSRQGLQLLFTHIAEETLFPSYLDSVAGIILLHGSPPPALLRDLNGRPLITLFCPHNYPGDELLSGHYKVGQLAGQYLARHGLRRFAALNAMSDYPDTATQVRGLKLFVQ